MDPLRILHHHGLPAGAHPNPRAPHPNQLLDAPAGLPRHLHLQVTHDTLFGRAERLETTPRHCALVIERRYRIKVVPPRQSRRCDRAPPPQVKDGALPSPFGFASFPHAPLQLVSHQQWLGTHPATSTAYRTLGGVQPDCAAIGFMHAGRACCESRPVINSAVNNLYAKSCRSFQHTVP